MCVQTERGQVREMEFVRRPNGFHDEAKHRHAQHPTTGEICATILQVLLIATTGWLSSSSYLKQRQTELQVHAEDTPPDMDSLCVQGRAWQIHDVEAQAVSLSQLDNDDADEDDFEAVEAAINAQLEQPAVSNQVDTGHRGLLVRRTFDLVW